MTTHVQQTLPFPWQGGRQCSCNYWSKLGFMHQVPITAGWTEAVTKWVPMKSAAIDQTLILSTRYPKQLGRQKHCGRPNTQHMTSSGVGIEARTFGSCLYPLILAIRSEKVPDGSIVKTSISGAWNVLFIIQRSWVQTPAGLNLGFHCQALIPC